MSKLVEPIGKIDRNTFLIPRRGANDFRYELENDYTHEENEGDQDYLQLQESLSLTLINSLGPLWTVASVQLEEDDGVTYFGTVVVTNSSSGNLAITYEGLMRFEDLKQKYRDMYGYDETADIEISLYDSKEVEEKLKEIDQLEEDQIAEYLQDAFKILDFLKENCLLVKQFKGVDSSEYMEMYSDVFEVAKKWGDKQYLDALKLTYNSNRDLLPNHATLNVKDNFTIAMEYKPFFLNENYVNGDNQGLGNFLEKARKTETVLLPDLFTLAAEDESYENFYLVNPDLNIKIDKSTMEFYNRMSKYAIDNEIVSKELTPENSWECDTDICHFVGPAAF